jgi:hypothetical protein
MTVGCSNLLKLALGGNTDDAGSQTLTEHALPLNGPVLMTEHGLTNAVARGWK